MNSIANLSEKEREDLFRETASRKHITNAVVEKDFWVVWSLDKIFSHSLLGANLKFKGGTSLSKIYGLIERFSEDIDLILNWDLLTTEDPLEKRSNTKQAKFNIELNEKAKKYIKSELLPIVSDILKPHCKCRIKQDDGFSIEIDYPSSFRDSAILPHILLEIGPLAMWDPSRDFTIMSYSAQEFPELFENPTCKVIAIFAERTFWEKATILHQQANRAADKPIPSRYSRHYYDLAMMAQSGIKDKALDNISLLKNVIEFKQRFYSCKWAQYEKALPGTFKLIPPEYRIKELKKDYIAMQNMIYGERIEIDELLNRLKKLEDEINNLEVSR
ncbi:MAG: nucleotidyl transferase AbiEii/AbiGii toxin family protein [Candidatus Stygibacter frigidus]|nr:nucleotidyl transferase AbiEii/AbiGii toxin family protein [Candidatus Stygibacter frigidus]